MERDRPAHPADSDEPEGLLVEYPPTVVAPMSGMTSSSPDPTPPPSESSESSKSFQSGFVDPAAVCTVIHQVASETAMPAVAESTMPSPEQGPPRSSDSFSGQVSFPAPPSPDEQFQVRLQRRLSQYWSRIPRATAKLRQHRAKVILLGTLLLVAFLFLWAGFVRQEAGTANSERKERTESASVPLPPLAAAIDLPPLSPEVQQDPNLAQRAADALVHGRDVEALRYYRFLAACDADEPAFATIARVLQRRIRDRCRVGPESGGPACPLATEATPQ